MNYTIPKPDAQPFILCVDDDPDDLAFLEETLRHLIPDLAVVQAHNGREALDYLKACHGCNRPMPALITLDINMPLLNGRETLAILKSEESLRHIPVVFFTTSNAPEDRCFARQFDVELLVKPLTHNGFCEVASTLLKLARLHPAGC